MLDLMSSFHSHYLLNFTLPQPGTASVVYRHSWHLANKLLTVRWLELLLLEPCMRVLRHLLNFGKVKLRAGQRVVDTAGVIDANIINLGKVLLL